jgi:uncharacterized membrane protein
VRPVSSEEKVDQKALETAIGVTNTLITLGTAVITVVVSALGLFKGFTKAELSNLTYGVTLEFSSIVFGLLTHGTIIATLNKHKKFAVVYEKPVAIAAIIQWTLFIVGLGWLLYTLYSYQPA